MGAARRAHPGRRRNRPEPPLEAGRARGGHASLDHRQAPGELVLLAPRQVAAVTEREETYVQVS